MVFEFIFSLRDNKMVFYTIIPMIILFELPLSFIVITGLTKWFIRNKSIHPLKIQPNVSCIITCYTEGSAISKTIKTLCEQTYKGDIEIIAVIDAASKNMATYQAALSCQSYIKPFKNRTLVILP